MPTEEPNPANYHRVFRALGNLQPAEALMGTEFADLEAALELIEAGIASTQDPNPDHWFPNVIAAVSLFLRAYQGLQAAANLCAFGFYVEALATLRNVQEAAGLGRTLAHKLELAERWLHGGDWVKDKFSKEFAEQMAADSAATGPDKQRVPHWETYKMMSQYAHPMARSTLGFLFTPDGEYRHAPYPSVDAAEFKQCAALITSQALFVAYAFRNAAADFDTIPAWWHQQLAALARRVSGLPLEHLDQDWVAHQERYESLIAQIQHSGDLRDALRADPNSLDNLRRRAMDQKELGEEQ